MLDHYLATEGAPAYNLTHGLPIDPAFIGNAVRARAPRQDIVIVTDLAYQGPLACLSGSLALPGIPAPAPLLLLELRTPFLLATCHHIAFSMA